MRMLLKLVLQNKKHLFLLIMTLLSMLIFSIATQMEIVELRILTEFTLDKDVNDNPINLNEEKNKNSDSFSMITKMFSSKDEASTSLINRWLDRFKNKFGLDHNITNLVILLLMVSVFKAASLFANQFSTQLIAVKVSKDLRKMYFEHIQTLPMTFYHKYGIGNLSARVVADANTISLSLNSLLSNYLRTPFAVFSSLIICYLTSWRLSLVLFIGLPLVAFPITFLAHRVKKLAWKLQRNQEGFSSVLVDFLAGIFTVKVFTMEKYSSKKYNQQNDYMANIEQKSAFYTSIARPILHTIGTLFLASVIILGLLVLRMSISELIMFCGLLYLCYEPIKKFAEENNNIQRGVAATERMFEVLKLESDIKDSPKAIKFNTFKDHIKFEDVWFRYEDTWVLKGVNFEVKKGETVALVGPTGSGKSTIVNLLPRLYNVEKGKILLDGLPLNAYTQKSIREAMAFVPQKSFLFLDTIASNISFGRDYSEKEIEIAAHQAHAYEFIKKLPNKYQTRLSEMGKNLSGGQQQRLSIARALVKQAPILILDEATSSLDAVSENLIKKAIGELHGKLTQIIVAHRLSTIEDADKIIYLEDGEITAQGTRQQLLDICPAFRRMWDAMYKDKKSYA